MMENTKSTQDKVSSLQNIREDDRQRLETASKLMEKHSKWGLATHISSVAIVLALIGATTVYGWVSTLLFGRP